MNSSIEATETLESTGRPEVSPEEVPGASLPELDIGVGVTAMVA